MGVVESNVVRLPGNHKSSSFSPAPSPLSLSGQSQEMLVWTSWELCTLQCCCAVNCGELLFFKFALLHFSVHCSALDVHCSGSDAHCARKGKYTMQKACKRNVQKMALDLKNGHKRHLIWEMAIGGGPCARLMKMNYPQNAKCIFCATVVVSIKWIMSTEYKFPWMDNNCQIMKTLFEGNSMFRKVNLLIFACTTRNDIWHLDFFVVDVD